MNLLGHWVCLNCDSVDPPTLPGDEKACKPCADEGENGLLVELVPASQLRGAVEDAGALLERLRMEVDAGREFMGLRPYTDEQWRDYLDGIPGLGGQS